ncbi:DNA-directed RNA polymerase I subunit rpa43 [Schizosaccharomyces pombe]|uniref:DNA-directed RNA polymerase I subunit rpa43 n=1 Tax=Schizosaccharomyces pombe (strain 972 / ATCC 24843) TaxID=284812 RepID=RPA43_SCHPO|nr:DNA-directed RNA polymerase I complex subunit Rpa43 [Schizosaccharomyces pombe]O43036.1 RecName: Full=DNA-directed RNA polymerase I subunit rpa43; Short=RNA polymerase I subunit A43; AltName: Full=DNA-dependent RNA polymerase 19 kDa polypeptide [Schizosaccharomyces pombe 972h-]7AOC_G Chain G, DNA-directed RNA polymerase I subunit rpa43 [Schizosaccharomyces pombe 972h-]7AOD_G Chain G, DNA-directed RNA polymerase I subunit rpa43 [Schizosaccharomyces pombe 972h-]7AOD_S Chain S, DNA-directed RNA|eukprot:NP_596665.1 DNA-directed RNA polymerase I complex subunit Rpa43 [Schizosaccharomyces pombe]
MPDLSLYKQTVDLYLSIAPGHSRDPLNAIQEHMDSMILSKLPRINGIVLAYDNIRFLEKSAKVMYDSPFSFIWVRVDVLVFSPKKGDCLEGKINLVSPSHIGLLILGIFNASIPRKSIPKDWIFIEPDTTEEQGRWKTNDGNILEPGKDLEFVVDGIQREAGLTMVQGTLANS